MVEPSRYNVGGDEADILKNKLGITDRKTYLQKKTQKKRLLKNSQLYTANSMQFIHSEKETGVLFAFFSI